MAAKNTTVKENPKVENDSVKKAEITVENDETIEEEINDWTIMVYMAGDNNLSEAMANTLATVESRINGLSKFKNSNKVSMLAYFDSSVRVIPPLYCDITQNKKFNAFESNTFQTYLERRSIDNIESSSSVDSIVNFVNWCVNEKGNKSKNYALFLSGHSNAFDEDTLLLDNSSKTVLTIPELKLALQQVHFIINADKQKPKKLDILGFDSCVMGMLEIGYEFRNLAKYFIASQGETPNAGWNYGNILYNFILESPNSKRTAREIAQDVVISYINEQRKFDAGGHSADISVWDLDEINNVISKVEILFSLLSNHLDFDKHKEKESKPDDEKTSGDFDNFKLVVKQEIKKSILWAHWNCQTHWFEQAIDIYDYCDELLDDSEFLKNQFEILPNFAELEDEILEYLKKTLDDIQLACKNVKEAIRGKCVIAIGIIGPDYQYSNGMSMFFPWSNRAFRLMSGPYRNLSFTCEKGEFWVKFLRHYLPTTLRSNPNGIKRRTPFFESQKNFITDSETAGSENKINRGTREDKPRGTREDKPRGTREDKPRGNTAFLNAFKTLKNTDSDNWDFFLATIWNEPIEDFKSSENLIEAVSKLNRKYKINQ